MLIFGIYSIAICSCHCQCCRLPGKTLKWLPVKTLKWPVICRVGRWNPLLHSPRMFVGHLSLLRWLIIKLVKCLSKHLSVQTVMLRDCWADVNESWHVYSMGPKKKNLSEVEFWILPSALHGSTPKLITVDFCHSLYITLHLQTCCKEAAPLCGLSRCENPSKELDTRKFRASHQKKHSDRKRWPSLSGLIVSLFAGYCCQCLLLVVLWYCVGCFSWRCCGSWCEVSWSQTV